MGLPKLTYEQIIDRVEQIGRDIRDPRLGIDEITELYCEAVVLVREGKARLIGVNERVVAGLEVMKQES